MYGTPSSGSCACLAAAGGGMYGTSSAGSCACLAAAAAGMYGTSSAGSCACGSTAPGIRSGVADAAVFGAGACCTGAAFGIAADGTAAGAAAAAAAAAAGAAFGPAGLGGGGAGRSTAPFVGIALCGGSIGGGVVGGLFFGGVLGVVALPAGGWAVLEARAAFEVRPGVSSALALRCDATQLWILHGGTELATQLWIWHSSVQSKCCARRLEAAAVGAAFLCGGTKGPTRGSGGSGLSCPASVSHLRFDGTHFRTTFALPGITPSTPMGPEPLLFGLRGTDCSVTGPGLLQSAGTGPSRPATCSRLSVRKLVHANWQCLRLDNVPPHAISTT